MNTLNLLGSLLMLARPAFADNPSGRLAGASIVLSSQTIVGYIDNPRKNPLNLSTAAALDRIKAQPKLRVFTALVEIVFPFKTVISSGATILEIPTKDIISIAPQEMPFNGRSATYAHFNRLKSEEIPLLETPPLAHCQVKAVEWELHWASWDPLVTRKQLQRFCVDRYEEMPSKEAQERMLKNPKVLRVSLPVY